jgi:WD40 repeat protein
MLAACAPGSPQPRFNVTALPSATSIPAAGVPRLLATLPGRIISFDVSPDGSVLALAANPEVRLYDLRGNKLLRTLNGGELASAVAWSPDGTELAVGGAKDYGKPFFVGGDSTNSWKAHLTVYNTSDWKGIFEPEFGNEMVNQSFYEMVWSPDGHALAFSTDVGGVQVLDAQTGQVLSRQRDFAATVTAISWSPDGSRLLANHDMAYGMRRWRLSDGESIRLFDPRSSNFMSIAWSADGNRIASGDGQGGLCFWTAATNRCDAFVHAHRTATFSIAWSPDGNQLATGGGVIRIWDSHSGALVKAFGEDSHFIFEKIRWLADGTFVTLQTSIQDPPATLVRLWDLSSGAATAEFRGQ